MNICTETEEEGDWGCKKKILFTAMQTLHHLKHPSK